MDKIMLLNGSPRAPRSNSKKYAELFCKFYPLNTEYFNISKSNHEELCSKFEKFSDIVFVFPLYADSLPVTLLNFLKTLEKLSPKNKPTISIIINCGFLECHQNDVAIEMIKSFCKKNNYKWGSCLKIGSGEAILISPFKFSVDLKIKKLAKSIINKKHISIKTTMPIPKFLFVKASTKYWSDYGNKNGISKKQMQTLEIEGDT